MPVIVNTRKSVYIDRRTSIWIPFLLFSGISLTPATRDASIAMSATAKPVDETNAENLLTLFFQNDPICQIYIREKKDINENDKFRLYRSLVNIRPAVKASEDFLQAEDEYLTGSIKNKGVTDVADLVPIEDKIYLWKGDITTLKCGAIVNAANSGMMGCYQPCHKCIDNCIHTFAGVRLRYECYQIMETPIAIKKFFIS